MQYLIFRKKCNIIFLKHYMYSAEELPTCITLDAHISNICRRAHFRLRNIGRIRMLLSFDALACVV